MRQVEHRSQDIGDRPVAVGRAINIVVRVDRSGPCRPQPCVLAPFITAVNSPRQKNLLADTARLGRKIPVHALGARIELKYLSDERHFADEVHQPWQKIVRRLMPDLHLKRIPRRSNILRGVVEGVVPAEQQPAIVLKGILANSKAAFLTPIATANG